MSSPYLKVLIKRNFFLLWFGQIISQFGDKLSQMALIGLVHNLQSDSPLGYAKMFTPAVIPVFLLSTVAGIYVDRWNKQKIMYVSDFLRGIFIFLVPFVYFKFNSIIFVYLILFFSFCIGRFFIPAKMAIIPSLVAKEDLFMANSLVSITAMIAAILGFGLGGMIVEKWGVKTAFILDACTFFISAILIFFMRLEETSMFKAKDIIELGKNALHKVKNSFIFEIKEGIKYLVGAKETRYATKIFFVIFSCIGAIYPIFIVFVQETFSSVTADLGWLAVSSGAGLFLGSVFYGRFGSKFSVKKTVNFSLIFAGAYLIFFVWFLKNNPNKIFALFSCFLMGLISSPMVIAINTLIHKESKNELWGRIFSSLEVVIHLAFIIFMFISAYLAEKFSTFTIIVAVGIIMFLFSFFNIFRDND